MKGLINIQNEDYVNKKSLNFYVSPYSIFNKSNTKISTHYCLVWLYPINICFNIFIANEFLNFAWNIFNSKVPKRGYIRTIQVEIYLVSSYRFAVDKI